MTQKNIYFLNDDLVKKSQEQNLSVEDKICILQYQDKTNNKQTKLGVSLSEIVNYAKQENMDFWGKIITNKNNIANILVELGDWKKKDYDIKRQNKTKKTHVQKYILTISSNISEHDLMTKIKLAAKEIVKKQTVIVLHYLIKGGRSPNLNNEFYHQKVITILNKLEDYCFKYLKEMDVRDKKFVFSEEKLKKLTLPSKNIKTIWKMDFSMVNI